MAVGLRAVFAAFIGALCLLSFGGFIERHASTSTTSLVTFLGLQQHEERVQDRMNALEERLVKVVEDAQQKRFGRLGGVIRKELIETRTSLQTEVKEQVNVLQQTIATEVRSALAESQSKPTTEGDPEVDPEADPKAEAEAPAATASSCPVPCIDVAILYHEDDRPMFVDNGVLFSIQTHVKDTRKIFILSKSDKTFSHLLDNRTFWFDEARVPFKPTDWANKKSGRPMGWLYQQTLKYWAAQFLPDACPNLMFIDADTVFLRDFSPLAPAPEPAPGEPCRPAKIKYNLSTQKSGAWYGDIENGEYHHFVEYITGLPKALMMEVTAINHWQVMQRDVMQAMARSIKARLGHDNTTAAMIAYGLEHNGMSEYEGYFSFAWYFYQDRLKVVNVPFVMREPHKCSYYNNETTKPFVDKTIVTYFTCHDNYGGDDYYTNCKGREAKCDPVLASA